MRSRRALFFAAPLSFAIVSPAHAATDLVFEYTSFEATFGQSQFDVLNYPSINGNYMMTSTDNHRPEMVANNNQLAEFYNWLTDRYTEQTVKNGAAAADVINTYTVNNSTNNGPKPTWLVLNEISSSLWGANPGAPSLSTYRTWLNDCVTQLTTTHGFKVITLAPFQNPGQNNASWQALSAIENSYIGIECYLSGPEVWAGGTDYDSRREWAEAQYAASKQSYINRGVPANKLFVTEHFANNATHTDNGTPIQWGRNNMASASDWDQVIMIRQDAIYNVGFDGFLAYNWGGNGMGVTTAEQIQHEYYYRSRLTLASQQPQWLSNTAINVNGTVIPLSWNEPLNWKGGVPNAPGAKANFFRTNTAARTITLDGSKTMGTLTFNSPSSYTISPGTGGGITLSNGGGAAVLGVTQGTHTIGVPLAVAGNATFTITGTLNTNAGFSTAAAGAITRSGAGTWTIGGTQSYVASSNLNLEGGTTNINSDPGGNLTINANATVNFGASQKLQGLNIASGKTVTLTTGGSKIINTNTVTSAGKLDLKNHAMVVRSGTLGTWNGSHYTGVLGLVQDGRNNGAWNGNGIITTMTEAKIGTPLTTLATALASQALGISGSTTWRGQSINGNEVLVAYTLAGDANLSGGIDADDYFQIDSGYGDPALSVSYFKGDFDYDGVIDGDDYFLIDSNYTAQQAAPLPLASVPEPAGFALFALATAAGTSRRRRFSI